MKQRLQKVLAQAGLASRRTAEQWIEQGRVRINGDVAELGQSADPLTDLIEVDGRRLGGQERKYYIMLYKPTGVVTTLKDPEGRPVVTDLVKDIPARLFPVGRLDVNTEGLLLLTNDGELANHLAHPRHKVEKTYLVRVRGEVAQDRLDALVKGVHLEDGLTAPAKVSDVRSRGSHSWFLLTIREGRNRQVRRMCESVGFPVSRLKRVRLGFLELGDLQPGRYRHLTVDEISRLKNL